MKTKEKDLKKLLKATGRKLYVDWEVTKNSPKKKEGTLEFFKIGKYMSDDELQKEYDSRGLEPADIYTLCEHHKELDEKEFVGTQWKDKDDKWCFASFNRWGAERSVLVGRSDSGWLDFWWFAGLRKPSDLKSSESLESLPLELESAVEELTTIATEIKYKGKIYVLKNE